MDQQDKPTSSSSSSVWGASATPEAVNGREWRLIEKLLGQSLDEQRRARRWNIFFRVLTFTFLFIVLFRLMPVSLEDKVPGAGKHTALIDLKGVIADDSDANADEIMDALSAAFEDEHTQGVVLRINSPGGSPVQSAYVFDEIRRLRAEHPKVPLYAVIVDIGASGAYYIASAADRIYVNPSSLVGSIGVIMEGFGFQGVMDKVGVERRLMTAGEHKGLLDPFSAEKPEEKAYMQAMLNQVHQEFINSVKQGRGSRLAQDPQMFSGLVWSGREAVRLGLADGFGTLNSVARDVIKAEDIIDYTPVHNPLDEVLARFGTSFGKAVKGQFDWSVH